MMILVVLLVTFLASPAWAEEKPKPPSCQEQLSDTTMQAYNLDTTRDQLERTLAHTQVEVFTLQQQVTQLQQVLTEMKKAQEKPKE